MTSTTAVVDVPTGVSAGALLARCRFPSPGSAVSCAVSGGADSSALLVLATLAGCRVTAVHVDHGTRSSGEAEAERVAELAGRYGAHFRAERIEVPLGPNFEERARRARYAVLPVGVLTGHTADDQAETVLLNLLRGASATGLAGMADTERVRRPLLAVRRSETAALCEAEGVAVFTDPSNDDPRYRRNRVRHELLPLLDDIAERDVAGVLARQAVLLRDDAALLDELAAELDPTDARALAAAPVALSRRAVRRWLAGEGRPPASATVERVLAVARNEVRAAEVAGGVRVSRRDGRLRLESR